MSELSFKEDWPRIKEKLKARYAILTDKDLQYEEDREEELLAHLEKKLGKTKHEVKVMIRDMK